MLSWFSPFARVSGGDLVDGDVHWFDEGKLNACYNCVDRHLPQREHQAAIIWEGDEPGQGRTITYGALSKEVSRIANVMLAQGVRRGDVVTVYMPMVPELAEVMLACAKIGAVHSVVFAGFSAEALRCAPLPVCRLLTVCLPLARRSRIEDCQSQWLFTSDEGRRGGKSVKLKEVVDVALKAGSTVRRVFVFERTGAAVDMVVGRDLWMRDLLPQVRAYCASEPMDSEDALFVLYTSGSTGRPKGVAHSTAGYLLNAALTTQTTFDLQAGDVFCCVADCGWITGHTVRLGLSCVGSR